MDGSKIKYMYSPNGRQKSVNLDKHLIGQSKITVVGRNFGPSKVTVGKGNFGPSKITIVDFGPS